MMSSTRYIVAQLGARMHYAVPRILQKAGRLEQFYTDICGSKGWPRFMQKIPKAMQTKGVRKLVGRVPLGIPDEKITTFETLGLLYALRLRLSRSPVETIKIHLWANELFCQKVLNLGLGKAAGVYTFNGAGLPLLQEARQQGRYAIMEQTIAPLRFESTLMDEERHKYPEWEEYAKSNSAIEALCWREENEWQVADKILCGSEFVRDGIAACGGPVERCKVVPYGVDVSKYSYLRRESRKDNDVLRVLTVGALGLRKGTPYLLAAAKYLHHSAKFRVVGSMGIKPTALKQLNQYVEVVGPIPRSEILAHYAWADVFLLPSLCEGSATVTYEALASGLPVICTPNTGSMVRHGVDGFIIPARDPDSIAQKLIILSTNRELLSEMSTHARKSEITISEAAYAERLLQTLD